MRFVKPDWSLEFRRDWYSVSHSRDLDLESVLSVKLQQRRFVLYRMQISFIVKR